MKINWFIDLLIYWLIVPVLIESDSECYVWFTRAFLEIVIKFTAGVNQEDLV